MPAEEKMKVQMQSDADAKMVDLPAEGEITEVNLDESPKKVNADERRIYFEGDDNPKSQKKEF